MTRKTRLLLIALCSMLPLIASAATKEKKTKVVEEAVMQRVGILGFAVSFKDSVVCLTEVQVLDSAYIEPAHGFLQDRSLYSLQLQMHLERAGYKNAICTVFFDKKPHKLQRTLRKIRKKYSRDASFHLIELPLKEFRFKAEEYRPVMIEETTETPETSETSETPATP